MQNNTELLCLILEFQSRSLIVKRLLQAEAAKEYEADWLKNAKVVTRDTTGRFASKGLSIKQSVQDTTAILKQGFDLTGDTIQSLVKDPEFRKRAGIATGLPMAKLISNLATQARLNPKLTEKLDEWIANATKEFADQYGDDKSPMAQAIRKANLAQPPKDANFNEKMEFRVAQYAAYKEALDSPEDFSKRDELIGKAAAASIPIGVSLAIALGFEVAIPLFLAQSVNWATVLSSVAIGEAADFAVQKGMDKLEINNPALRIGASMVAGILAGGLVTGVNNKIKNTQKLAKEESERSARDEVEKLAKEEVERNTKSGVEQLTKTKAPFQKVIDEMGLNFSEVLKIIDNHKNSIKDQDILLKEISELLEKRKEVLKNIKKNKESTNISIKKDGLKESAKNKSELLEKEAQLRIAKGNGYSFEKRLLEAADILEKEGRDSPRYLWRKAVLQAEIKYGKYLDKIQGDSENGYTELMASLKKSHNYKAECIFISSHEKGTKIPTNYNKMFGKLFKEKQGNISHAMDELQSIINIPLKIHIGVIQEGVFAQPGKKATSNIVALYESSLKKYAFWEEESNGYIELGGCFDNGLPKGYNRLSDPDTHLKEMLWHEAGHLVELSILKSQKMAQSFLEDRGLESLLISELDPPKGRVFVATPSTEKILDHFFHEYMGTKYIKNNTTTATELISSGFEGLSSPWMAKSMAIRDRESLLYAIAVMEMN